MSPSDWKVPAGTQPKLQHYRFDLDRALSAVLSLSATVPADAFTAETLGTERAGNAVLIGESGLVLTIGYLVTEASSVWLTTNDGKVAPGHVLGVDAETGFGLVQALGPLGVPALAIGRSASLAVGDPVVIAGAGGRRRSIAGRVAMKQEFAGYWEYLLDEALFTAPAHPHWGGTALIGQEGELLGIGSLQLQQERPQAGAENVNMMVPIDLLGPILDDMLRLGRSRRPVRPWLGVFATEIGDRVAVAGVASKGPADQAGLQVGDILLEVLGEPVLTLAGLYRAVWSRPGPKTQIPFKVQREGRAFEVTLATTDRALLLKRPVLH